MFFYWTPRKIELCTRGIKKVHKVSFEKSWTKTKTETRVTWLWRSYVTVISITTDILTYFLSVYTVLRVRLHGSARGYVCVHRISIHNTYTYRYTLYSVHKSIRARTHVTYAHISGQSADAQMNAIHAHARALSVRCIVLRSFCLIKKILNIRQTTNFFQLFIKK